MKFLWMAWALVGVLFITSAVMENGLLPSGHGPGRIWEALLGVAALGYAIFRFRKGYGKSR